MRKVIFVLLMLLISVPAWAGQFTTSSGGNIIDPNGNVWQGRGMNVYDSNMGNFTGGGFNYASLVPKLSFIRLACYSFQSPSYYDAFINLMTGLGIVVIMEDHQNTTGKNAGGAQGQVPTGTTVYANGFSLPAELNWYTNLATHYINNPYVWFGTNNEPPNNYGGGNVQGSMTTWQQQTYNAIRGTGSNTIIAMELLGGGDSFALGANNNSGWYPSSTYAGMTNIIADYHIYSYVFDGTTTSNISAATMEACITASASSNCLDGFGGPLALIRQTTSATGTLPIMIGEYGPSTIGTSLDTSGNNLVTAIQTVAPSNNLPTTAWNFYSGDCCNNVTDGSNNINTSNGYGVPVQTYINAGAGPVVPNSCSPSTTVTNTVVLGINTYTIDAYCNYYTITPGGQVSYNGVPIGFTSNVVQLAWVNPTEWQKNNAGNWYSFTNSTAFNVGGAGFASGPQTASPITGPCSVSANNATITTTTATLYDAECNAWSITSGGQVAFNGTTVGSTANVIRLAYKAAQDEIWQENASLLWYFFNSNSTTCGSPCTGQTNTPLPTPTHSQ